VLALPELEHQEAPESVRVVPPPGNVLVQEPGDGSRPEQPPCAGRLAEQDVACERAQVLAKPARDRDAEPGLAARRDERRERILERAAERDLAASTIDLLPVWERNAELEDGVVEERRANLQRVRHRGEVRLQQQVAG